MVTCVVGAAMLCAQLAEAAVTAALRGPLGKGNKDQTVPAPLAPLSDTARLKRGIAQVCDRISKGGSLVGAGGGGNKPTF